MSTSHYVSELPESLWAATAAPPTSCPRLEQSRQADICVIGAGFTGLSTALHAAEAGASVHAASPVSGIQRSGERWCVQSSHGEVTASQVFVCTNAYTGALRPRLSRSLIPVVSYQAATEPLAEALRSQILPKGHVASDTRRLLKYFCMDPEGRIVMGGRGSFRANARRDAWETQRG